jgi:hypothetical protein
MLGNRELALEAARRAATAALRPLNRPSAVLVFDAASRRKLLGPSHAMAEIEAIRGIIGGATPLIGCYTYGQQAPVDPESQERTASHIGSILIVALGT